ncbi:MAG: LD-carboxypeptidase, partial [bacterium]
GYLGGADERRAEELMGYFKDPEVKAIFPGTGGYGATRILGMLDYETIRKNPKIILGFSDITGLHLALSKKCGLITFHGPLLMYGLGSKDNLTTFSATYFHRALFASENATGKPAGWTYEEAVNSSPVVTLVGGKAQGRLVGGNLSLVAATMGTPFEIETQGKLLFLEDVNEEPYRVDRMLSQLKNAGKLNEANGFVLGMWRDCEPKEPQRSLTIEQVFEDYFKPLGKPTIIYFPAGHWAYNATLPMGAMAALDADSKKLTILENPVTVEKP